MGTAQEQQRGKEQQTRKDTHLGSPMYCCFKRSLPAIYFHLLALLSPFSGEEKNVFLFSLIRYNNVCFDNKNRGNCISSVLREDPTFGV